MGTYWIFFVCIYFKLWISKFLKFNLILTGPSPWSICNAMIRNGSNVFILKLGIPIIDFKKLNVNKLWKICIFCSLSPFARWGTACWTASVKHPWKLGSLFLHCIKPFAVIRNILRNNVKKHVITILFLYLTRFSVNT